MDRFFKKISVPPSPVIEKNDDTQGQHSTEFILSNLPSDPGKRIRILDYNPNIRDQVRRAYVLAGPQQPKTHNFPYKKYRDTQRRFNPAWFDDFPTWLEYSVEKDVAFCLCCYLFKPNIGEQAGGDFFVGEGFSNWKKKERLLTHIGGVNSAHNQAWSNFEALRSQKQHIQSFFSKTHDEARIQYRARLNASIDCCRFLLRQGLAFRGNDESEHSSNHGNFLELLQFLADHNEDVKAVTLKNAPENHKLTSPDIQKDIVNACATETIKTIIKDIGTSLFSILIDESRDVSTKEQMAIVLRYVDKNGHVVERFIGIEHVTSTAARSLKETIDEVFSRHKLSMSRLRGQGYDGASNMQGEFNGLKALIMKDSGCAYYIHCFAHQLQLALVAVAKKNIQIESLFSIVTILVNVVGASSKRCDLLRENQSIAVIKALNSGEFTSGKGKNQETTLKRAGETRWGSHFGTLVSIMTMFSSILDVLEVIADDGVSSQQRCEANNLLDSMQSFDFVFNLHLMKDILGITNELSQALQRKDQDIVNAMKLVGVCKQRLEIMRKSGWDSLLSELQELNNRFNETNTELLLCLACLCPTDSFSAFDSQKLLRLAQFYPKDFSMNELVILKIQLETYIMDMRSSIEFSGLKEIGDLAKKMVQCKKHKVYSLVYLLVTLALTLPVATATVERAFLAMKILKNRLRNRMGDQWMNDNMVIFIEREIFDGIGNDVVMQRFQNMKTRRGIL
ncbi:uncharacterized protein [Malus domestica]|uniref:uncharacterized protein n=1 Tax=Malus domestica TaxID=3750 RepID=UPI0039760346